MVQALNNKDIIAEARDLLKVYKTVEGPLHALNNVSLHMRAGEFISLIGPSGSGKTTLLYCLSGLDQADKGSVTIAGTTLYAENKRPSEDKITELRAKHIGFIFQSFNLLASLTALENVMIPLRAAGRSKAESRELATHALSEVGMAERRNHRPFQMSGGEQQRVAVARALVNEPAILLADEPTGNLDQQNGRKVVELLREICERRGTAVIMVSHIIEHAEQAHRILMMQSGKIIDERTT